MAACKSTSVAKRASRMVMSGVGVGEGVGVEVAVAVGSVVGVAVRVIVGKGVRVAVCASFSNGVVEGICSVAKPCCASTDQGGERESMLPNKVNTISADRVIIVRC